MVTTFTDTTTVDRARPVAPLAAHPRPQGTWRSAVSMITCGTTGLSTVTTVATANFPAGGVATTIERPTRILGTRST